ncbi:MAG TPA: ABC transporter permease [Bryobacteraceae bacterium]|nr:ABC transporter permease [Bryobacteraceae bacterium]
MGIRVIAGLTLREAVRRRTVTAGLVLGGAFLALYGLGVHLMVADTRFQGISENTPPVVRRQALNVVLMMGMYAANWLVVLLTVLSSVDTLAGEIASGTMQSLATKPLPRREIVLGKWLGFAGLIAPFLLLLGGGVILEMWLIAGHLPPNAPAALALIGMESLLLLAVTFRLGVSLSTLATGITVLGLHMLAFLGGWIEEFGAIAKSETAVNIGVIASLLMPSEALWRKAASGLQGAAIGGFGQTPFSTSSVPSAAMVVYAAVYMVAALGFAVRRFSKRDL